MKWIAVTFPHLFQGSVIFIHGIRTVKNSFVKVLIVIVYLALYNHLETCNAPYHYADSPVLHPTPCPCLDGSFLFRCLFYMHMDFTSRFYRGQPLSPSCFVSFLFFLFCLPCISFPCSTLSRRLPGTQLLAA